MPVGILGYIPFFILLMTVLIPILTGIPCILFVTKSGKFDMIPILDVLLGEVAGFGRMGISVSITDPFFGMAADLVCHSEKKRLLGKTS